jgi:hypothetical protein
VSNPINPETGRELGDVVVREHPENVMALPEEQRQRVIREAQAITDNCLRSARYYPYTGPIPRSD